MAIPNSPAESSPGPVAAAAYEPVFLRLVRLYREAGFDLRINLNPAFFAGWSDALFCTLYRDGRPLSTGGGGIAISELCFFECLRSALPLRSLFVIGNSGGWSTLALSLLWPAAEVVAIDCGMVERPSKLFETFDYDRHRGDTANDFGLALTNTIARTHGLKTSVILGTSPQDLARVIGSACPVPPQLVFIDGGHSNPQIIRDFEGLQGLVDENCIYVFHDVVNWHLEKGFAHCCRISGREGHLLWRTASGMAILLPAEVSPAVREVVQTFADHPDKIREFRRRAPRRRLVSIIEKLPEDSLLGKLKTGIKWVNARLPHRR
jgi:hypothetical protein